MSPAGDDDTEWAKHMLKRRHERSKRLCRYAPSDVAKAIVRTTGDDIINYHANAAKVEMLQVRTLSYPFIGVCSNSVYLTNVSYIYIIRYYVPCPLQSWTAFDKKELVEMSSP